MTPEIAFIYTLLGITIVVFASGKLRLDVVSILVILALMLSGSLSPSEALAGFSDPVVILIAGLFVVGEGLFRTGVSHSIGNWLMRVSGTNRNKLMVMLMTVVAGLSAFMSSTGAVAIFIPVVLNLAFKINVSPSRLLMPLAFASLIGGMLTLIGTPPNLIVSNQLTRAGLESFGFFDFTPIGLVVLIVGITYTVLLGYKFLPLGKKPDKTATSRMTLQDLLEAYKLTGRLHRIRVQPGSALAGKTLAETELHSRYGAQVIAFERAGRHTVEFRPALKSTVIKEGQILYLLDRGDLPSKLLEAEKLEELQLDEKRKKTFAQDLGIIEILLSPRSKMIGSTLGESSFRSRYGATVLGISRKGRPLEGDISKIKLTFGDSLLISTDWKRIRLFQADQKDFLVLTLPQEFAEVAPNRLKAPRALAITLLMIVLMTFKIVPNVAAVLLAALAMIFGRCVDMEDAYASINWESLILIAGMLPVATALEKTGGAELIVKGLVSSLGDYGPVALMAGLFAVTSVLSQFISNTATTVLIAPIALGAAHGADVSPYPFLMTIALAASTAFSTPVSSPVNTMVLGPGEYRFVDFIKMGVPLQVLAMIVTLLLVPILFPF